LNLDKENQEWKQNLTNFNKDLEDYLITIDKKYSVDDAIMNIMESFFAEVANYTKMITSSSQQTSIQSSGSLCNYISNCSLTLIGSFALDCMRNNNLCIDAALVFHEEKSVSEMELLQMYKNELEKYHEEYSAETSSSFFDMQFSIEKSEKGNYVSVVIRTSFGNIQINIQVSDPKTKSCKLPIHHIKRIYDSFEQEERLNHFRSLMRLMRLWK